MPTFEPFYQSAIPWLSVAFSYWIPVTLLLFFIGLSFVEVSRPHVKTTRAVKKRSLQTNAGLFLINSILLSLASASSLLMLAEYHAGNGLLSYVANPFSQAVIAFLIFDLILYGWHVACHRFDFLWAFHRVHHSDDLMNVSTAFRVHIIELILTNVLKAMYIIILGVDKMMVVTVEALMTFFIIFHHANLTFCGENLLKYVFIVPALHRAHHSVRRDEHDRNYGAVFSVWDRLFGTLTAVEPARVGINNNPSLDLMAQILLGFTPIAPAFPQHREALTAPSLVEVHIDVQAMVAEAAYYRAEKRGFAPGYELADWFESEKEIINKLSPAANDCRYSPITASHANTRLLELPTAA